MSISVGGLPKGHNISSSCHYSRRSKTMSATTSVPKSSRSVLTNLLRTSLKWSPKRDLSDVDFIYRNDEDEIDRSLITHWILKHGFEEWVWNFSTWWALKMP